ncbi:hypothetical protein HPP92_019732 [Vanilla planifolia]|uniref:VQ domain-containing protein n=1 Tax=Vanilla planifolia TaxID=51239 RepID=A0A835Q6B4_VANPL|nr:hypothetical protein HPP92_019732 [Vanilla planifolia]
MKVVIIETIFVETDAEHFKSVVQQLTGKEPAVASPHRLPEQRASPLGVRKGKDEGCEMEGARKEDDAAFMGWSIEELCRVLDC